MSAPNNNFIDSMIENPIIMTEATIREMVIRSINVSTERTLNDTNNRKLKQEDMKTLIEKNINKTKAIIDRNRKMMIKTLLDFNVDTFADTCKNELVTKSIQKVNDEREQNTIDLMNEYDSFQKEINAVTSFEEAIGCIKDSPYIKKECTAPDELIMGFMSNFTDTMQKADLVAETFLTKYGDVIVCKKTSKYYKRMLTIMDVFENYHIEYYDNSAAIKANRLLLKQSFSNFGFKRARECRYSTLQTKYCEFGHQFDLYDSADDSDNESIETTMDVSE